MVRLSENKTDILFNEQMNRLGALVVEGLNLQSRLFLYDLWVTVPFKFDLFLTKLERSRLALKSYHLNQAVASLFNQMTLPSEGLMALRAYLLATPEAEIDSLIKIHAPELRISATANGLLHHDLPHALEIRMRIQVLMQGLGILNGDDRLSCFLRSMVLFIVQFHDHEQVDKGEYDSVEAATAARVSSWIKVKLNLPVASKLNVFIDFLADRLIVLGTTMIYSATRTMDLSELFLDLKQMAISMHEPRFLSLEDPTELEFSGALESNAALIHHLDAIMLITGVADKTPAAIYDAILMQSEPGVSIKSMLSSYIEPPLLLERFFQSDAFISPFGLGVSMEVKAEAFITALIPHVSMRAEITKNEAFVRFIALCRQERLNYLDHVDFMTWFKKAVLDANMPHCVEDLFFNAIQKEVAFCQSQKAGLVFVSNKLILMRFPHRSVAGDLAGHFRPLINTEVPMNDAKNLIAFKSFYDTLSDAEKVSLVGELILAIVVQVGEMKAEARGYLPEPFVPAVEAVDGHSTSHRFWLAANESSTESKVDSGTESNLSVSLL